MIDLSILQKCYSYSVKEITEDSEYEVAFKSGKNHLVLRITLGTDFPNQKPLLVVTPLVNHPWVNKSGVVTSAPGLLNVSGVIQEIFHKNLQVISVCSTF